MHVVLPEGGVVNAPIGEFYELCHGPDVLDATRAAIREAYRAGTLKVEAVDPATGAASLQTVTAVLQHHTPHKDMVRVTLADGRWVECTVDHSLFCMAGEGVTPVLAGELRVGSIIATVSQGVAVGVEVASVVALPPRNTPTTCPCRVRRTSSSPTESSHTTRTPSAASAWTSRSPPNTSPSSKTPSHSSTKPPKPRPAPSNSCAVSSSPSTASVFAVPSDRM